jgi:hypothetical protein
MAISPRALPLHAALAFLLLQTAPQVRAQTSATSPAMNAMTSPPEDAAEVPDPAPDPAAETDAVTAVAPAAVPAPSPRNGPATVPGIEDDLPDAGDANAPGTTNHRRAAPAPPPTAPIAAALPSGSGALDSATVQRIVERLVGLHLLASTADAQNPETFVQAIKDFQTSAGISPSGTLDRDTIGRLTTP